MTPHPEDDTIVLHSSTDPLHGYESGHRVLMPIPETCRMRRPLVHTSQGGFAFGMWPDGQPMPDDVTEYHWGTRTSTGRLTLLRGPDPRVLIGA